MNVKQRYPLFPKDRYMSDYREQLPAIETPATLVFADEGGKIRAGCCFAGSCVVFDFGLLSEELVSQGTEAIKRFAEERTQELIDMERQRRLASKKTRDALYRAYRLVHHGVVIEGFVKQTPEQESERSTMTLTMTAPFQLEKILRFQPSCFAAALGHWRSLDDDGKLLDQEIKRQEESLVDMYEIERKKRNKPPAHPLFTALQSDPSVKIDGRDDE